MTKSIFDKPIPDVIGTRKEIMHEILQMLKKGYEMSWFTTEKESFDWTDINVDEFGFLVKMPKIKFDLVSMGFFHRGRKKSIYKTYEVKK